MYIYKVVEFSNALNVCTQNWTYIQLTCECFCVTGLFIPDSLWLVYLFIREIGSNCFCVMHFLAKWTIKHHSNAFLCRIVLFPIAFSLYIYGWLFHNWFHVLWLHWLKSVFFCTFILKALVHNCSWYLCLTWQLLQAGRKGRLKAELWKRALPGGNSSIIQWRHTSHHLLDTHSHVVLEIR